MESSSLIGLARYRHVQQTLLLLLLQPAFPLSKTATMSAFTQRFWPSSVIQPFAESSRTTPTESSLAHEPRLGSCSVVHPAMGNLIVQRGQASPTGLIQRFVAAVSVPWNYI